MTPEQLKHLEKRRRIAVEMRNQGRSFREIAEVLAITPQRARQVVVAELARQARPKAPEPPPKGRTRRLTQQAIANLTKSLEDVPLTTRAYMGLYRVAHENGLEWPLLVGDVAIMSPGELFDVKNVGYMTVAEIRSELEALGLGLDLTIPRWHELRAVLVALRSTEALAAYLGLTITEEEGKR